MLDFLFKKETSSVESLNEFYSKLKEMYSFDSISEERKASLKSTMDKFGYLPYPQIKALEELSDAEVLFALESKWEAEGVFKDEKFEFDKASTLARNNVKNSSWLQKEGHNIKLINLAALGNGNESDKNGTFMDWLRELLILPTGNKSNNIFGTTMYLIPFHPREFGCAYLPTASCVSPNLEDKAIAEKTGLNADEQVKTFIQLTQLAGHPVIYDILPQTGRFSKIVLTTPDCARWFDINALIAELSKNVDEVASTLVEKYSKDDLAIVSGIYKKSLKGEGYGDLTEHYQNIFNELDALLKDTKIFLSNSMLERSIQDKLHKKAKNIINKVANNSRGKKMTENEILNQGEIIGALINEGMWPAPGGAWCSAGVPVFDKMSDGASYPTFKHYKFDGEDVTHFANLDCQTPYYFVCLENGKFNNDVVKFFIDYMKNLQEEYNFDGFRVDHIDHIVDEVSENEGTPISYRAPRKVLGMLNSAMKDKVPYFAALAEYMLWDNFYKEYHQDMNFDLLWGNDIVSQSYKTPEAIADDNLTLANYNSSSKKSTPLSILKTYNNQDGEFEAIDRYPAQLGREGALFKWFKYKFIPGGRLAQRPVMYVDGDESFTNGGIEAAIGSEISMKREKDYDFFAKFDAIDRFVKNSAVITDGEAHIIRQDDDGFAAWMIQKEGIKNSILVIANYNSPSEKFNENGQIELREGHEVFDKTIELSCDYSIVSEFRFDGTDYIEEKFVAATNSLSFGKIMPAEFKFFTVIK
ncbi:MAG: hypothetical protein NC408_09945 [Candidatus Gastranaerophilales bacterium]|nr:hypothetical protein [Candidatus Gastranaerophilales bacterium]MCM1073123.1 hypothetical protein [Bacteroides sp.]